jgi:hypothetical protein
MRLRLGLVGLVIVGLVAAAGCTSSKSSSSSQSQSQSTPTTSAQSAGEHAGMDMGATPAVDASPQARALSFDQLLGQNALMSVRLSRDLLTPEPNPRQASLNGLQTSNQNLSKLVASSYGGSEGSRFQGVWERQTSDLSAYADAVAKQDTAAKDKARNALLADAKAFGDWLASASKGKVDAASATAVVKAHVQDLMAQADTYAAKDYNQAYKLERQAYERLFSNGVMLAKPSVSPKIAAGYDAPTEKLRAAFAMLLGEHMEMIIEAQRATFAGQEQFKAAAAQVNANTAAITQGMAGIVGPQQAKEFQAAWAEHVNGLMAYTAAVADTNTDAKTKAVDELNQLAVDLAVYFSHVVKNQQAVVPLTGAVTAHDTHLTDQVDAFAAKDYVKAQQLENAGYQQMLGVSDTLVNAIQRSVKASLPVGGSQTGGGSMAHKPYEPYAKR